MSALYLAAIHSLTREPRGSIACLNNLRSLKWAICPAQLLTGVENLLSQETLSQLD